MSIAAEIKQRSSTILINGEFQKSAATTGLDVIDPATEDQTLVGGQLQEGQYPPAGVAVQGLVATDFHGSRSPGLGGPASNALQLAAGDRGAGGSGGIGGNQEARSPWLAFR